MTARTAPYGTWESPIDAVSAASHDGRPEHLGTVGEDLWWTAPRPAEGGRRTLMRRRPQDGTERSVLPAPWNVRTRVIEYGGVPWAGAPQGPAGQGPLIVFAHFDDQRLYAYEPDVPGAEPRPLTPVSRVGDGLRWAEPRISPGGDEAWCVLEEFTGEGPEDVRRVVAAVPLDGSAAEDRSRVRELSGDEHRFVTSPRISPDGRSAVWIAWDHPRMPWDGTELKIAEVTDTGFTGVRTLIGGPNESVAQAEWAEDGTLLAVSDRTGWWNLHRVDPVSGRAVDLCPREEEFAGPAWRIGSRWFAPLDGGLVAVLHGRGALRLGILDPADGKVTDAPGPWSEWDATLTADGTRVTGIAATARTGHEIVELDTHTGHSRVVAAAHHDTVDPEQLPDPVARVFSGPGGRDVHAHVYPPHNPRFTAPDGELPPYVIWVHGGPTSRAPLVLDLTIAYFTSRGIGVAEVNYGGSTGYGRAYRDRLKGQWGVVDVEDCVAVADALVKEGMADPDRLAIRGGSAGGWTTGAALTGVSTFACGTISYPVLDLAAWARGGTHDFESRYLETLIGPIAEVPERYEDRSPANRADRIRTPFLLLQGLDDAICPPAQSEGFLARAAGRGVPHAYLTFEGEGHGFRRQETVVTCLEAELSLYGQTFGFTPPAVPTLEMTT
ncbi:prolyl oligopeptidase family serine peptidase [Streptomyces sp. PTM05]|uniref:Prolyl oligopeptidase family serine peptidase n=1 Tax=Streptantibioticus parmotrematis TaxID=2873249 RepID=A0ABS7QVU9_9ACTN|nr:prolyl oligopeptidase family serine peptidase [Streptantibioticus parmotrematis]MBY8885917.1 prolyl oligopeptidase family serine peptidase [Streptantibioticus parmotrematis]